MLKVDIQMYLNIQMYLMQCLQRLPRLAGRSRTN